jgi:hypothetical protein
VLTARIRWKASVLAAATALALAGLMNAEPASAVIPSSAHVRCTATGCKLIAETPGSSSSSSSSNTARTSTGRNTGARPSGITRFDISRALVPTTCQPAVGGPACLIGVALGLQVPGAAGQQAVIQPVVTVTPGEVAQMAVSQLDPGVPKVFTAPQTSEQTGRTDTFGLVGMPVWMWTEQLEGGSATATAGPFTVTATAALARVSYDMGDGKTVTCTPNASGVVGTPYQEAYGVKPSPTCGYAGYQKTSRNEGGNAYTVTATATWNVTWTGADTGSTTLTTEDSGTLPIGEAQAVVTSYGASS